MTDLITIAYQKWKIAVEHNSFSEAEKYYHHLRGAISEPKEVSFVMGLWYRQYDMYPQAIEALEHAARVNKASEIEILYELANTFYDIEQYNEAKQRYEELIVMAPEDVEIRFAYGHLLGELGLREEAKIQLCQVIALTHDVESYINVAVEISAIGRGDIAIELYFKALMLAPDNYYLYSNLAVELAEMGDYEDALYIHHKGIEMNCFAADLWYNLACTHALMEQEEEGLMALEKAIGLDDSNKIYAKEDQELEFLRNSPTFWKLMNM